MVNSNNRGDTLEPEDRKAVDELKEKIYEDRANNTRLVDAELEEAQLEAKNIIAYQYEDIKNKED